MNRLKPQQFIAFTERSRAWDAATLRINQIVDEYNRMGASISPQQREALHRSRMLYTLQQEPELFREIAFDLYNQLLQQSPPFPDEPLFP